MPLTNQELNVIETLANASDKFTEMPGVTDQQIEDFDLAIRTAQRIVMALPSMRDCGIYEDCGEDTYVPTNALPAKPVKDSPYGIGPA